MLDKVDKNLDPQSPPNGDPLEDTAKTDANTGRDLTITDETVVGEEYVEPEQTPHLPVERSGLTFWGFVAKFFMIILQVALMIGVLAGSIFLTRKMIADKPEPRKRPAFKTVYTIETVKAKKQDRQPIFVSYGQTVAARTVDLRSLVSGEIIKVNPNLRAGAQVAKGDPLVEIDDFTYTGALSEAKANLQEAEARILENEAQVELEKGRLAAAREQLQLAQADLERAKLLKSRGNTTQKEVDTRNLVLSQRKQAVLLSQDTIKVQQSRVAQIKASIDRLKWRVQQAERNLASTTLVAPFAGIVKSSTAETGRAVTANDVVVSLNQADSLEVRFTLTDAQYGRLQNAQDGLIGREVKVIWSVGGQEYVYQAMVDRVGAEITSNRGGVELYARVGDSTSGITIRPGAFVEVHVPDKVFTQAVVIPDTAIYGTETVYVEVDGKLKQRAVTIAAYENEMALVTAGLNDGDEVLTTRITEVSEGLRVRREGDPVPSRRPAGTDSKGAAAPAKGRPSRAEIGAILKKNELTFDAWRALPQPEKRKLIQAHRAAAK